MIRKEHKLSCLCEDCGPKDYESCSECGFDHQYEYEAAHKWHKEHPRFYYGLNSQQELNLQPELSLVAC